MKRSASVPNAGMPSGKLLARGFLDLLRLLRIHQAVGAFLDERIERDAVDEIERIEDVALRLRHLLAFGIAHEAVM